MTQFSYVSAAQQVIFGIVQNNPKPITGAAQTEAVLRAAW